MSTDLERGAFSARLNELCDDKDVPPKGKNRQSAVAKIFTVSQKGARKWLEGEGFPTMERCIEIAKWGGCTIEWLVSGRGPKYATDAKVDANTSRLLRIMEQMPDYLKPTAVEQIRLLAGVEKKKAGNG